MPYLYEFNGKTPQIHPDAWVAPNATLIGDVRVGKDSSIFYGCVLRADTNSITIGERTNVQDNSVIHVDSEYPTVLGDDVTIGHMALVHGAEVANCTLIGMKAALLSGSRIGSGTLIAAGAVVLEDQEIPAGQLAAGIPAKVRKELDDGEQQFRRHAAKYVETARQHAQLRQL